MNEIRLDTVFLDFGGTLFYEKRRIPEDETTMAGYQALKARGLRLTFQEFRSSFYVPYTEREHELAKNGLEIGLAEFTREVLPELGLEPSDENVEAHLWGRFQPHSTNNVMYDDTIPALEMLRPGYKVGLISNAQPDGILWQLDSHGIKQLFDEVIISGAVGFAKPNPEIFTLAAAAIGSEPSQCMMVGDSPEADAMGAENVGMTGITIDRTGKAAELKPDVKYVTDLRQIERWLNQ